MDRIECRRAEEALDRQAWLKAYRSARMSERRRTAVPPVRGIITAQACLQARAWDAARALERMDLQPRSPRARRYNWLGEAVA